MVAEEFKKQMAAKGVTVNVHHIREARPKEMPPADLYLFSSPGRMGKPIGGMRRFLKKTMLPSGTKYAVLTTEAAPQLDKKTGRMPTEEELAAGGGTLTDTLHIILGMVTVLFMLVAIGFGANAFGKLFRIYSIGTIVLLLVFGALTGLDGPRIAANLPTPWVGVWERISIAGFLLWVVVPATALLRAEKGPDSIDGSDA